jgi:arylsulfatase
MGPGIFLAASLLLTPSADPPDKLNVVLILADDLGWGDLGCYGQTKIRTPNIDRLAKEGMRFTNYYSGSPVCAPSRCAMLTGKHTGHAAIRDNKATPPEGQWPLPAEEVTFAELLKQRGYVTGAMGKWGLGQPDTTGDPNKHGFDLFFGYHCQGVAHNHYPTFVRRNGEKIVLEGNPGGPTGKVYSNDLFEAEALKFLDTNKDKPFFLYLPFTIPHLALQVPQDSLDEYLKLGWEETPYTGKAYQPHPTPRAAYAAMITRMDRSVGRVLDKLKEYKLEGNTLVLFASDNGGATPGSAGVDTLFFQSFGPIPFRNSKGSTYEGGMRVPLIVRWPGKVVPGTTTDLPAVAYDLHPTICEATGTPIPRGIDGISLVPTLQGKKQEQMHEFLYWEFPSYGGQQAVRAGKWKAVRQKLIMNPNKIVTELYDLEADPGEKTDVAAKYPEVVARLEKIMVENHTPSKAFPFPALDGK